jgi:hypothetical protein
MVSSVMDLCTGVSSFQLSVVLRLPSRNCRATGAILENTSTSVQAHHAIKTTLPLALDYRARFLRMPSICVVISKCNPFIRIHSSAQVNRSDICRGYPQMGLTCRSSVDRAKSAAT